MSFSRCVALAGAAPAMQRRGGVGPSAVSSVMGKHSPSKRDATVGFSPRPG